MRGYEKSEQALIQPRDAVQSKCGTGREVFESGSGWWSGSWQHGDGSGKVYHISRVCVLVKDRIARAHVRAMTLLTPSRVDIVWP